MVPRNRRGVGNVELCTFNIRSWKSEMTGNESLREFLDSFSYGSRTDLNFQFLSALGEDDGGRFLASVIIAVDSFRPVFERMKAPRVIATPHPMGRPLGPPKNRAKQKRIVSAALDLLDSATQGNSVVSIAELYFSE